MSNRLRRWRRTTSLLQLRNADLRQTAPMANTWAQSARGECNYNYARAAEQILKGDLACNESIRPSYLLTLTGSR